MQEKNKLLEQEEMIRKAIENASKTKEKELEQLKLESQKETKLLEQEEKARKAKEEELLLKEKEYVQVNDLPPKKWTQRRVGVSINTSS